MIEKSDGWSAARVVSIVSNTLPADLAGAAEAEAGDVTARGAGGGSDDCEKPPAGELLGTTTTAQAQVTDLTGWP